MATSSITVTSQPTLVYSGGLKDALIQNSATGSNVFFSDTPNLTSSSYSIQLLPGTPLEWPAGSPLWAICAPGSSSTVTVLDNGSSLGVSVSALQSAINALIAVTSASANPQPNYVNAAAANTLYDANLVLVAGIYVVSCASGVVANVDFYDANNTYITTATTVSGTITLNIASAVATIKFWTTSGTNTQIEILKQGSSIAPVSGTLYTYTTSQNIPLVGDGYFILIGGGGGGGSFSGTNTGGGGGGGSGAIIGARVTLTGSLPFVAGAGGTPVAGSGVANAGGTSSFAGYTASGGGGGYGSNSGGASAGAAGSPNGGAGGIGSGGVSGGGSSGNSSTNGSTYFSFFAGTTGGGGGGGGSSTWPSGGGGGGSGFGTGGSGGYFSSGVGNAGSGGGGGGGAAGGSTKLGGTGGNGILYIIM